MGLLLKMIYHYQLLKFYLIYFSIFIEMFLSLDLILSNCEFSDFYFIANGASIFIKNFSKCFENKKHK